ncbi:MAG: AlpA family transcriptional regulator [Comamonadaceae bacterium]|nr:AlpA family transcriptional regulator [Comamonadaceae bacterium]
MKETGLGRTTIYRLISERRFPPPFRLSTRAVGWRRADIDAWSDTRAQADSLTANRSPRASRWRDAIGDARDARTVHTPGASSLLGQHRRAAFITAPMKYRPSSTLPTFQVVNR